MSLYDDSNPQHLEYLDRWKHINATRSNRPMVTEEDITKEQERFQREFGPCVELRRNIAYNRVKSRRILNDKLRRK